MSRSTGRGERLVDQQIRWRVGKRRAVRSVAALTDSLLSLRGVKEEHSATWFDPLYERDIHSPASLYGIELALDRLLRAKQDKERVLVWGDYDADGVTAAGVLVAVLREIGIAVTPYLPHRMEDGYGLNRESLNVLLDEFEVLIAADCGVSNFAEITWLAEQDKDVIVVDHHEIPEMLPPALALLHPRHPEGEYPYGWLSGAGVAWKLAAALLADKRFGVREKGLERWLLDLAVLGTLADVVPLTGENRALVHFGLKVLRRSQRPGLRALLSACRLGGSRLTTQDVVFRLVPRLNAAGRVDHPQPALDLLLAETEEEAQVCLRKVQRYNVERQTLSRRILAEAQQMVGKDDAVVFAANISWPAGIVGLVASRLAAQYGRPAVIIGGNGRHAVGSARGGGTVDILRILQTGQEHMLKLGGHAQAAGFSLESARLKDLEQAIQEAAEQQGPAETNTSSHSADLCLDPRLISWPTYEVIERFEPFGPANARPVFIARDISLHEARQVGKQQEHLKLSFRLPDRIVDAIGFKLGKEKPALAKQCDVLFELDANEWQGRVGLQMVVKDIQPAGTVDIQEHKPSISPQA